MSLVDKRNQNWEANLNTLMKVVKAGEGRGGGGSTSRLTEKYNSYFTICEEERPFTDHKKNLPSSFILEYSSSNGSERFQKVIHKQREINAHSSNNRRAVIVMLNNF